MRAAVIALGLFTPNYPDAEAWLQQSAVDEPAAPTGASLDRRNRRLASPLMRAMADVYAEVARAGEIDMSNAASVFGSSLGEASTMIGLLDQMWAQHEAPSPMGFAASVHNAASGAVSISNKNTAFTTSIAADYDTAAMALHEALGVMREGQSDVIVVCGDESAPEKLVEDANQWNFLCCGLGLSADLQDPRRIATISSPELGTSREAGRKAALSARSAANPMAGMLDLIDAIQQNHSGHVCLDRGRGRGWSVTVEAK